MAPPNNRAFFLIPIVGRTHARRRFRHATGRINIQVHTWFRDNARTLRYLVLATFVFALHSLHFNYPTDDAFITFRYVRNMLEGDGLVYNPGERVEGYTNFLWAMVLAVPAYLGMNIVGAARMLGFLSGAGTILAVTLLARDYIGMRVAQKDNWMTFLPATFLALNGSFAMWAVGGLETLFFTFLLTLATVFYLRSRNGRGLLPSGLLFALLVMTRPDGAAFLLAALAHLSFVSVRSGKSLRTLAANALRMLVPFAGVYAPYFAWRYSYYGFLLPNTFYAKVGGGASAFERGLSYTWNFALDFGIAPILGLAAFFYARAWVRRGERNQEKTGASSYLAFQLLAGLGFVLFVGGDQLVMHRFFVPLLPAIYLLTSRGFAELRTGTPEDGAVLRGAVAPVLCFAALVATLYPSFFGRSHHRVFRVEKPAEADRAVIGKWLKETAPEQTTIALVPAGIIPFYSDLRTIDLVGLNDVHIAHTQPENIGKGEPGHEKYDSKYVLGKRPDLIFLGACRLHPEKLSADSLLDYYWIYGKLVPGNREMLGMEEFTSNYSPWAAKINSGYLHFMKRNDFAMPEAEPLEE